MATMERDVMPKWKPTYDLHATREAAQKDAARRQREAKTGRTFAIRKRGDKWTVVYRERE